MKTTTAHAQVIKTAIGYVRVSTLEQASEGVSLDAQRNKIKAYCEFNGIRLVAIHADEGASGGTLERPGLQASLRQLERGRANTLVVVKLDRLTRSVRDLCLLVDQYFAHDLYHLQSVCGMVNTHNAAGRMMMLNLATYAQFEREIIAERTREALQYMKAQGIKLGGAPYGFRYSRTLVDGRRRDLEPVPAEQEVIRRMAALHAQGRGLKAIANALNADQVASRQGGKWHGSVISAVLQRDGQRIPRKHTLHEKPELICDRARSSTLARELREKGMSLRQIGACLTTSHHVPPCGGKWHASTVAEHLRHHAEPDRASAADLARELRNQGLSLREISYHLFNAGHQPTRGGKWHPATVRDLMMAS